MGSGDIKAELATVGPPALIVSFPRSGGGGLSEKIPCMERLFCSLSNTANVKQPGNERTPTLWLITSDKDKAKRKGQWCTQRGERWQRWR